jgi:hypothetical protein
MRYARTILTLILALAPQVSHAQTIKGGWTICTRDLQLRDTLIERANERELTLINAYGIRSVLPMDQVLFVVKSEFSTPVVTDAMVGVPMQDPSPVRLISLADGQTIRGSLLEPDASEQISISLIAGTSVHGDAHIPLEQVLSIRDQRTQETQVKGDLIDDLVVMRNGDRISGFIESVGPVVQVSADDRVLDLDIERVERILIANEPDPIAGVHLRFVDHEIIRVLGFKYAPRTPIQISIDPGSFGLEDSGATEWRFDPGTLDALWIDNPDQRVVALSAIEPERVEPMGDRAWVPSPIVINTDASHEALRSIDFQSPARVRYPLPEGASRFACTAEAPIETWTDCIVRVIADRNGRERQVFEQRLHPDSPDAGINVELPRGTSALIIEIDPGAHGPIQDRVLMHRPRLLVVD